MDYYLDGEFIIREVENYKYLYDTRHSEYNNRGLKKKAWMTVTQNVVGKEWGQMDESTKSDVVKEVQKRWRNIKDSFQKSIRKEVGKSGNESQFKKPHIYNQQMNFLRAVLEQRENSEEAFTENSTSMEHETLQGQDNVTGNVKEECEVYAIESSPSPTNNHLTVHDDGTTQLLPSKRLKTDHTSSTGNIILRKILLSSTPKTVHDVTGNAEEECEVRLSDSNPSPTNPHLAVFNNGTTHPVPAKQLKTGHFSCTENIKLCKKLQSAKSTTIQDSNELFLRSLLHDMSKLNPGKLRHFKTFVITKLTNLLDEQDAETVTRDLTDGLANPYILESFSLES